MIKIVCAANLVNNHIVCGVRHYDKIMHDMMEQIDEAYSGANVIQGFVDNRGNFHNRQEAWCIAKAAGQLEHITEREGTIGTLYSEHLY